MKALICSEFGSTQDLTLEERDNLEPGAGEVLIDVKAAGVNFPDILTVEGKYQFKPPLPFIPGTEVSGVVSKIGDGVTTRKVGDEVINWSEDSLDIFNFVRGICFPGPQARAFIDQDEVKINKVTRICDAPTYKCVNGAVVGVVSDGFLVKTGDSLVKVIDFTSHRKIKIGDRFR